MSVATSTTRITLSTARTTLTLCLLSLGLALSGPAQAADITGRASVIDGDTIEIQGQRIRLYAIDAPESSQICADADNRAWRCGRDAALLLDRLLSGRTVACTTVDRDRYGRVVARCAVAGEDMNRRMVAEGLAVAYTAYGRDYAPDEAGARTARRGLWSGRFVMPWDHRKGVKLSPPPAGQAAPRSQAGITRPPPLRPGPPPAARSRATSPAMAASCITCPAGGLTSRPGSTRAMANAGSAPKPMPGPPAGRRRAAERPESAPRPVRHLLYEARSQPVHRLNTAAGRGDAA
ncbi:thermonuclease family protein [Tistrella bauzanensis]